MKKLISSDFLFMRLLVGYLGEKDQFNWWPTTFICSFSNLFLSPVFPRTTLLSQYHGILEAARRLHDERIGVGSVFHLFRLPEV
ncbi:MAG: BrxE family protein, partial [Deltaproteobacteria bacterium]